MEISPEERRHIQNLSVIPAAIVCYIFLGIFLYLIDRFQFSPSLSFLAIYFGLVFFLAVPTVMSLAEFILLSRRTHKPLASFRKVFLGRMALLAVGGTLFGLVLASVNLVLPSLDQRVSVVLAVAITFVLWGFLVFHYREWFSELSHDELSVCVHKTLPPKPNKGLKE